MFTLKNLRNILFSLFFTSLIISGTIWAGEYPGKAITMICPYAAGGSIDTQTRAIAPHLGKELNVSILVENVPGANGVIGYNKAFKSKPDGYTLLTGTVPTLYTSEILSESSRYRTVEFIPIYAYAQDGVVFVVHPEVFPKFEDFIKASKSRTLSVGVVGRGTPTHLGALVLEKFLGVKFTFVPFEGGAPCVATLAGKHLDAATTYTSASLSMIRAGKIKPLMLFSPKRNPALPDAPIPKELGYDVPAIYSVFGMWGPPNISSECVKILEAAFDRALKNPDYIEWTKKMASEFISLNAKDFKIEIERQIKLVESHREVIK